MAGRRREQVEYVYAQSGELKASLYHAYGARGPNVTHLALVCRTCRAMNVFRVQDVEDKYVGTMVRSFLTLWDRHTCGAYVRKSRPKGPASPPRKPAAKRGAGRVRRGHAR